MVELVGVSVRYTAKAAPVFTDLSLVVDGSVPTVVTGASGAGKTTLLRVIHGTVPLDAGQLRILDHDVAGLRSSSRRKLRRRVAYLPQETALFERRTVRDNVAFPLLGTGEKKAVMAARVGAALTTLSLKELATRKVNSLSTGERRRVLLARVLVSTARVALLDEPTSHLDKARTEEVLGALQGLSDDGVSVLATAHDGAFVDGALARGWRVHRLEGGSLKEQASPFSSEEQQRDRVANG